MYNQRTIKINVWQSKYWISYSFILQNIWPYRHWAWGCPFLVQSCICRPQPPHSTQTHILHKSPNPCWIIKVVHQEDKSAINDLAGMLTPGNKNRLKIFDFMQLGYVFKIGESELIIYMTEYWLEWKYWVNSEMRNIGHLSIYPGYSICPPSVCINDKMKMRCILIFLFTLLSEEGWNYSFIVLEIFWLFSCLLYVSFIIPNNEIDLLDFESLSI